MPLKACAKFVQNVDSVSFSVRLSHCHAVQMVNEKKKKGFCAIVDEVGRSKTVIQRVMEQKCQVEDPRKMSPAQRRRIQLAACQDTDG